MTPSTQGKLRIAIVGAGYVASHHLSALKRLDHVDVIGVCDSNLDAAQALASRFGLDVAVRSLTELADARLDAVYVLTPPSSHATIALQALDMGCHVLVEKPMADTVSDCEAMIERAHSRGLVLGVNHSDLFDPVVMRALKAARSGRIGQVVSVDIVRNSEYPAYAGGPLPAMVTQGSYPFRDLGVHGLYTIEAFLGPLTNLDLNYQARDGDPNLHYDEWQAQVVAGRGVGRMLLSWNARPMENRLIVRGTHGIIEVDRFLQTCRVRRVLPGPKFVGIIVNAFIGALRDVVEIPWNVVRFATGMLKPSPGIQHGARAFAEALRDGVDPPFTGGDALRIARLLEPACMQPDRQRLQLIEERYVPLDRADALVTGAGGFLGRDLVRRLREDGKCVRVLVRRPLPEYASDSGVQMVVGDLGDPRTVDHAVAGADVVYHVGAAMRGSLRDFEAGTLWGTRNVVDACRAHKPRRLVYVSSMSVFDHAGRDPGVPMTEHSPFEPRPHHRGAYTQTKLAAERTVHEAIEQHALPAVIIRPGQIFGPGAERVTPNGVIALAGRWIAVGRADQTIPLVYLSDVVDALVLAADSSEVTGQVFNVVDPCPITQGAYLSLCRRKLGDELRVVRVPSWMFMGLGLCVELLGRVLKREVPLTRYRVQSLRPLSNFDGRAVLRGLKWSPAVGARAGLEKTFG